AHAGIEIGLGDLNGDGSTSGARGDIVAEILPPVAGQAGEARRVLRHDPFGQPTAVRDATGSVTRYEYYPERDADGDSTATVSIDPLDATTGGFLRRVIVDSEGAAGAEPLALSHGLRYDALGRPVEITDPDGYTTRLTFNALDQIVEIRAPEPLGYRRFLLWDADDRLREIRIENLRAAENGLPIPVPSNPAFEHTFERDLLGDPVRIVREVSGGDAGPVRRLVETIERDRRGDIARRTLAYEGGAPDLVEEWTRDARGLVISHTTGTDSGEGATRAFAYDPGGRVVLEIAPADIDGDGARERWEERYDGFGRLVARIDPLGGTRIFERDAAGRIVSDAFVAAAGGSGLALLERTLLEHDARGRLARRSRLLFGNGDIAREVVETFAYDPEGRLVKETGPGGRTRELLRDGAGR